MYKQNDNIYVANLQRSYNFYLALKDLLIFSLLLPVMATNMQEKQSIEFDRNIKSTLNVLFFINQCRLCFLMQ